MERSIEGAGRDNVGARDAGSALQERTGRDERDADAKRHDDQIGFSVVPGLQRLIPVIEHLQDGCRETDGEDDGDAELPKRHRAIVTKSIR